jgi:hypothetical protein
MMVFVVGCVGRDNSKAQLKGKEDNTCGFKPNPEKKMK